VRATAAALHVCTLCIAWGRARHRPAPAARPPRPPTLPPARLVPRPRLQPMAALPFFRPSPGSELSSQFLCLSLPSAMTARRGEPNTLYGTLHSSHRKKW
jgi:hypothetical protein